MNFLKTNIWSLVYVIYVVFVLLIFIGSVDIIPLFILKTIPYIILLCLFLLFIFISKVCGFKRKGLFFSILFILSVSFSYFFNIDNQPNFSRLVMISIYPVLLFCIYYLILKIGLKKINYPIFLSIIIIVFFTIISSLGLYNFEFYSSDSSSLDFYSELYERNNNLAINGVYLNQNSFAPIMMIGIFSSLLFYNEAEKGKLKKLSFCLFFICLIFLFLTLARGPIISIFLSFLLFLLFSNVRIMIKVITFIFCIIALIFFLKTEYSDLLLSRFGNSGFSHRDIIWQDAWMFFENNFWFGVGLGNYTFNEGYRVYSTHNFYLFLLVSLGFLGSIFIFFIILFNLFKAFYTLLYNKYDTNKLILSLAVISILFQQFFEVDLDNPLKPLSFLFVVALACINFPSKSLK